MKKKIIVLIISILAIFMLFITMLVIKKNDKKGLKKIKVAEVTHSVFYTPLYVALENGYFKDEGLDIELILTPGADKVSTSVISGDSDIGFAGAESTIYVYNGDEKDYLQTFAGLTKRDGQFIVSRDKNFKLENLYGKEVLVGRYAGMPSLNFINALKNSNIDINKIKINYSVDFAALSGTFISGVGDYVNLFEPTATAVEEEGYGYVVQSIGKLSGEVPYTTFYAKKSYIKENKNTLIKFTNAIKKAQDFVKNNNEDKIADIILPQFPDLSKNSMKKIIKRYKDNDSWLDNPYVTKKSFENLENIMIDASLLKKKVPYEKLVNNLYEK